MKSPILYMLIWQVGVLLVLSALACWVDITCAYSLAIGASIYIVSNSYFALYAFRYSGSTMGPWVTRSFSLGESGKLALTAMGFALAFRFVQPLNVPALFLGFCSMIILQWFIGRKIAEAYAAACDQQSTLNELEKPNEAD